MNIIQGFEQAVLTVDPPDEGLVAGDVGTVADITTNGKAATLEFFNFARPTIAVCGYRPGMPAFHASDL